MEFGIREIVIEHLRSCGFPHAGIRDTWMWHGHRHSVDPDIRVEHSPVVVVDAARNCYYVKCSNGSKGSDHFLADPGSLGELVRDLHWVFDWKDYSWESWFATSE